MLKNEVFRLAIPVALARQRLDKVLTALLEEKGAAISRARLQALIKEDHVTLSKKTVSDANRKVKEGEVYMVAIPPPEPATPKAQAMKLAIVYEDKDLLVIDKPPGLVVHPAPGHCDNTLVNALLAHCGDSLSGIGGVARPGIVHRLDKDTGGLMIVAKNDHAHQALTKQFADRSLSRVYHALVWGVPVPRQGSIEGSIGRHPRDRKKMAVTGKGREALTHYKVLKVFDGVSLIECRLATGRTHQIRVHFAHRKHPLIGDAIYGGRKTQGSAALRAFPRQALHAVELKFTHPRTGKIMRFKSELPEDIAGLLKALK